MSIDISPTAYLTRIHSADVLIFFWLLVVMQSHGDSGDATEIKDVMGLD